MKLEAFKTDGIHFPLRPAKKASLWLRSHHGIKCLPLRLACQSGWEVLSPCDFTAVWNGKRDRGSIEVTASADDFGAKSNTGHGILNISFGYVFRTSPGHNLWIRGPANAPKHGASPLEGIVETDWAPVPVSASWKLTEPGLEVSFEKGEPLALILPFPRDYLERVQPSIRSFDEDPELLRRYEAWVRHRKAFFSGPYLDVSLAKSERSWHGAYHDGTGIPGAVPAFPEHQKKLTLKPFSCDVSIMRYEPAPIGDPMEYEITERYARETLRRYVQMREATRNRAQELAQEASRTADEGESRYGARIQEMLLHIHKVQLPDKTPLLVDLENYKIVVNEKPPATPSAADPPPTSETPTSNGEEKPDEPAEAETSERDPIPSGTPTPADSELAEASQT